jgi:hypothetical protein
MISQLSGARYENPQNIKAGNIILGRSQLAINGSLTEVLINILSWITSLSGINKKVSTFLKISRLHLF